MARPIFFTGRIEDDRGNRFRLSVRTAWHPDSLSYRITKRLGLHSGTPNEQIVRSVLIRRTLLRRKRTLRRKLSRPVLIAILALVIVLMATLIAADPAPFLLMFVMCAVGCFLYQMQFRRWEAQLPSIPNVCVACAYDLSGIEPESDGCTVCPECGAAWNLTQGDLV